MRKVFLTLLLIVSFLSVNAQTGNLPTAQPQQLRFGYLSCDSVLHSLPQYAIAKKNYSDLKAKYDAEMKRVEDEFNMKYELFLEQQSDFAPSIRQKRQAELQELMEKNQQFKMEAKELLANAKNEMIAPLKKNINAAITRIGQQQHLAFVINTDADALPYYDMTMAIDITGEVIRSAK